MINNKINRPVLLIGLTILFVIILSHFLNSISIFGYTVKPVDLFSDIKSDTLLSSNSNSIRGQGIFDKLDSKYNASNKAPINRKIENLPLTGNISYNLLSKLLNKNNNSNESNLRIEPQVQSTKIQGILNTNVQITGNLNQMKFFFNALKNLKNNIVRIAHYGDSGNEGDAITADIRKILQNQFGGKGVGYLSITSQDVDFRFTTKQTFSDNWKTVSVLTANPQNLPLGINGFVAIPQGSSWVRYETTNWDPQLKYFSTAKLFYSNAINSSIRYSINGSSDQNINLKTGADIKELDIPAQGGNATNIKITSTLANQAYFYGVSLESGNGVYVDNIAWRGNTGIGFREIPEASLRQFAKLMNHKLIILMFGNNEATFTALDNTWYSNQMIKIINKLKTIFPESSILMITVGDKDTKDRNKFVTDPNIIRILNVQKDIAAKTGIAYWNLFEAMGGNNSMDLWVHSSPPLAMMDYTHASSIGASHIGQMIANAIINAYKNYK
jgi:hypothetical protein